MVTLERKDDSTNVSIVGQLEYEASEEFLDIVKNKLLVSNSKNITVDLSRVNYVNSMGIGTIVTAFKLLREKGKGMSILHPQENVMKVIKLTKINEIIPVVYEGVSK